MRKVKVGENLTIYCYKHDGTINSISEEAVVLESNDDMLVCANKRTKIRECDGRVHFTNEPAVLFFYTNSWFNIIGQLKKYGLFYYCNIASPFIIEGNIVKYIDYDLDLRVFPDGGFKILDRNEYNYHKKKMGYSAELDLVIRNELTKLINMKRNNSFPFREKDIHYYYEKYKKIMGE